MGLDMWLYKRGHTVHDEMTGKTYVEDPEEIGYWRKFNALHAYILELTNSPADTNCEPVDLSQSDVETILDTLNQVRSILEKGVKLEEDGDWYLFDEDTSDAAAELLPPRSGFFFGSTTIDAYYYYDVCDAISIFENALKLINEGEEIYYDCWW